MHCYDNCYDVPGHPPLLNRPGRRMRERARGPLATHPSYRKEQPEMTIPRHRPYQTAAAASDSRERQAGTDSRQETISNASSDAYFAARSAVIRLAEADGAQTQERPLWPGAASTTHYAEPLAGIRAAQILERTAARVTGDYVRHAREAAVGWREIGEALGLAENGEPTGYDLAVAAYEHAAGTPDLWNHVSFSYTCPTCAQAISDHGPYESHPEDSEQGHAGDCARLAADVAAWQAERDAWAAEG